MNNMNDNKLLETMKKNIADNIKQLDDIKRRVELLGHGYSKSEITNNKSIMEAIETLDFSSEKQRSSVAPSEIDDKDAKIISLEKENEKLRKQLDEVSKGDNDISGIKDC